MPSELIPSAQPAPTGWTGNVNADAALVMLDRLDVSSDDDARVDEIAAIVRRLAAPAAIQPEGQEVLRQDALCDAAYVAGARAGFDAAASHDPEALNKLIATRAGYIPVLRATRAAQAGGGNHA